MNWIKPIHKGEDRKMVSNYQTIMVRKVIAKLYRTIMEQKISSWAEHYLTRACSQAGFRPKHSIVDHLVTVRFITKEF